VRLEGLGQLKIPMTSLIHSYVNSQIDWQMLFQLEKQTLLPNTHSKAINIFIPGSFLYCVCRIFCGNRKEFFGYRKREYT
jgi:hypothetical protein